MNFCSRSKIESMQECVETGVVFCQPIVQRPHVARDLFGDRRTRKESVIRTTATKCSNQGRSSNSWVKMRMQHCLLLGLLKGAGSRAFFPSTPPSSHPMEAHATNPTWATLDLTPMVWARCRSGTGSRSAPEADPLASREGLRREKGVEEVPVINLTGSPSGQTLPED